MMSKKLRARGVECNLCCFLAIFLEKPLVCGNALLVNLRQLLGQHFSQSSTKPKLDFDLETLKTTKRTKMVEKKFIYTYFL